MIAEILDKYQYVPFRTPLPVWDYWYLLVLPLCAGVAVVYKSVKCRSMRDVPREATVIFLMILGGLLLAAGLLVVVLHFTAAHA